MKNFRKVAALLAVLLVSPLALHASASDALAVVQQCGRPVSDVTMQGSAEYPGPLRVMSYRSATLHFQQSAGGWNFIFANPAGSGVMRDRTQTGQMLPCFHRAMDNVQIYTPLQSTSQPTTQTTDSGQLHMRPLEGYRPLFFSLLALLYVLPAIIGFIRRPAGLNRLVVINLLLGWTILGWGYALLLANEDPAESGDELAPSYDVPLLQPGFIGLNILHASAQDVALQDGDLSARVEEEPLMPQKPSRQPSLVPAAQERAATPQRTRPLSFAFSSSTPPPMAPEPGIRWTDDFAPSRPSRIDVVSDSSQVTVYDIEITKRGLDPLGREVIGGYVGKTFMVFPIENILHLRDLAA